MKESYRQSSGITLVTVIIMIIVMIILSAIAIFNGFNTSKQASFAKFSQEYEEIEKCVMEKRVINGKKGTEYMNQGFAKVRVAGTLPSSFTSISGDGTQAYLVNMQDIGCSAMVTGQAYTSFQPTGNTLKTVTFGQDDVFVFDKNGKLYYVQGFSYQDHIYYTNEK